MSLQPSRRPARYPKMQARMAMSTSDSGGYILPGRDDRRKSAQDGGCPVVRRLPNRAWRPS